MESEPRPTAKLVAELRDRRVAEALDSPCLTDTRERVGKNPRPIREQRVVATYLWPVDDGIDLSQWYNICMMILHSLHYFAPGPLRTMGDGITGEHPLTNTEVGRI